MDKPWREPEIVRDFVIDRFEQQQAFIRLPLPFNVKQRMVEAMIKNESLEDVIIEEKTPEEREKDLSEKYILPELNEQKE